MPLLMGAAAAEVGAAVLAPAPNPSRPLKASNDAEGWAVEGDADDDEDDAVGADMPAFMSDKSTRPPHVPAAGVGVAAFLFAPLAAAEKSPKSSCCWGAGTRIVVAAAEVGAAGAATGVGKVIGIDMGTDEDANTSKAAGGLTGAEAAGVGMDDERPKASNEAEDDDGAEDDKPNASKGTAAAAADDDDDGAGAVGAKKSMLLDDDENKSIDDEVAGAGVALVADDDDEEGTDAGGAGGALTGLILMMGAFLTAAGPPAAAAAAAAALIGAGAA